MENKTKVITYIDKQGRRRRREILIDTKPRRPRRRRNTQRRPIGSLPTEPRGNPAVVETFEDARENQMINRDVPTMKHGGEAVVRGMGAAIKGGKFEGVF